jgi:predicted alpha/beta hydrolase family esterase
MHNLTVIFAHGRESGPWGDKIRALAKVAERLGARVISRDDSDTHDPGLRVSRLIEELQTVEGPFVLVGSSMGGYVVTVASRLVQPVGLFLMAPALGMPGYADPRPEPHARQLSVVHGWDDDVVPFDKVLEFARSHQAMLHLVPAGHALVEQLDWLTRNFADFLQSCMDFNGATARERLLATF